MGLFVEFKATGLEEFLARSEIDFVVYSRVKQINKSSRLSRPMENNKI